MLSKDYKTEIIQENGYFGVIFYKKQPKENATNNPQTTQSVEIQPQSVAENEIKKEKTTQTPQGVEGLESFGCGFYTKNTKFDFKTAEKNASELQKQGFKVAILDYGFNDKYGIICAMKSLYDNFKSKFQSTYIALNIYKELEPKEPEIKTEKIPQESPQTVQELQKEKELKPQKTLKKEKIKEKKKSKSNDFGMGM